jgi:hypothetical protein
MSTKELREHVIYAAPITSCLYGKAAVRDVVDLYKEHVGEVKQSKNDLLRSALNYANSLQMGVLRALESVHEPHDRMPMWGDWIMERRIWNYADLYVVVRTYYEKLDIVLDKRGRIVGVTEVGEAYKAVEMANDRGGWPFVTGLELPTLASYRVPAEFLSWQRQTIENIWFSPERHCHVCGSRTIGLRCSHTQAIVKAIQGDRSYEYKRNS